MTTPNQDAMISNQIIDNELSIINISMLVSSTGKSYIELNPILRRLVRNQQLFPIEKGLYCVRNFRNPYVIGNALLKDSAISYWSALNLHGLTEQIPNVVYVQSTNRKENKKVFNIRYKFIQVKPEKVCGIIRKGYGSEQFRLTDVEKTLLDCFDLPQHSGGYEELIRAFYEAKPKGSKLLKYGVQMNNLSVLKRIAYLSELFEMDQLNNFRMEVLKKVNDRYTLFDPMGENNGSFNSKWRIRCNIPEKKLLDIIHKMY
jgi:predicted transcriptional regulator of viral defense system